MPGLHGPLLRCRSQLEQDRPQPLYAPGVDSHTSWKAASRHVAIKLWAERVDTGWVGAWRFRRYTTPAPSEPQDASARTPALQRRTARLGLAVPDRRASRAHAR